MKNYLSLASIQAKVHRKQNCMTIFCIALAVILVTGVFTMGDMELHHETVRMLEKHGNWHICLTNVQKEEAEAIVKEAGVREASWYDEINYHLEKTYKICGKFSIVCGAEQNWDKIMYCMSEGSFPKNENEIAVTDNVRTQFGKSIGDMLSIETPQGSFEYKISGFCNMDSYFAENDAVGALLSLNGLEQFAASNYEELHPSYYVQFRDSLSIRKTITNLKNRHGWDNDQLTENTAVLAICGMSSSSYVVGIYSIVAVLVVLVMLAGILMIAGSMNSNIAERTQFFGMLRCIGTSKRQIKHIVRFEALNWCKRAIPIGVIIATLASWGICAVLRFGIGGEWSDMPVFRVSIVGILAGTAIGIFTVLLASVAPARRASKVTPVSAISGNANNNRIRKSANTSIFKIESALGVHHATSQKKGLFLMTGSYALSIIIFLSFSVMIDWVGHALNSNKPYSQDMSVYCDNYESLLSHELVSEISKVDGVKYAYGRMYTCAEISATKDVSQMDLISYEAHQFEWAEDEFLSGDISKVVEGNGNVMTVFDKNNPLETGDKIWFNDRELTVAAVLSDSPFSSSDIPTVLCSEETFEELTGTSNYAVIDIHVDKKSGDEVADTIRKIIGDGVHLSDVRASKSEANSTYQAFTILVYGFLGMLALITVFNVLNSISMSVSAKNKQYGIMRAIGMDNSQVTRMIFAEAASFAFCGCITGGALGLLLQRYFYRTIISHYFGDPWRVPVAELAVIMAVVVIASCIAVYRPSRSILQRTVTETINEL